MNDAGEILIPWNRYEELINKEARLERYDQPNLKCGEARAENNDRTIYDPETLGFLDVEYAESPCFWVKCRDCEAFVGGFDTEDKAIIAWNKRISDIAIPAARLQEICKAEEDGRLVVLPVGLTHEQYVVFAESIHEDLEPIMERAYKAAEAALKEECRNE